MSSLLFGQVSKFFFTMIKILSEISYQVFVELSVAGDIAENKYKNNSDAMHFDKGLFWNRAPALYDFVAELKKCQYNVFNNISYMRLRFDWYNKRIDEENDTIDTHQNKVRQK